MCVCVSDTRYQFESPNTLCVFFERTVGIDGCGQLLSLSGGVGGDPLTGGGGGARMSSVTAVTAHALGFDSVASSAP